MSGRCKGMDCFAAVFIILTMSGAIVTPDIKLGMPSSYPGYFIDDLWNKSFGISATRTS